MGFQGLAGIEGLAAAGVFSQQRQPLFQVVGQPYREHFRTSIRLLYMYDTTRRAGSRY